MVQAPVVATVALIDANVQRIGMDVSSSEIVDQLTDWTAVFEFGGDSALRAADVSDLASNSLGHF